VKSVRFHPKALEFIREQSPALRQCIGEAIRDLQKGMTLGMPLSKPMPSVASGVYELRLKDKGSAVRIFYFVKLDDAILVFHGFQKKTQKTPQHEIVVAWKRLKEVSNVKS
jgi:phage-related protein